MALMWVKLYPRIYYTEFYKAKTEAREKAYEGINEQIGVSLVVISIMKQFTPFISFLEHERLGL